MKITKTQLKQIIKEELGRVLSESDDNRGYDDFGSETDEYSYSLEWKLRDQYINKMISMIEGWYGGWFKKTFTDKQASVECIKARLEYQHFWRRAEVFGRERERLDDAEYARRQRMRDEKEKELKANGCWPDDIPDIRTWPESSARAYGDHQDPRPEGSKE